MIDCIRLHLSLAIVTLLLTLYSQEMVSMSTDLSPHEDWGLGMRLRLSGLKLCNLYISAYRRAGLPQMGQIRIKSVWTRNVNNLDLILLLHIMHKHTVRRGEVSAVSAGCVGGIASAKDEESGCSTMRWFLGTKPA